MQSEHEKILHMVEEGTITAEEAQELLEAMEDQGFDSGTFDEDFDLPESLDSKKNWQRPFSISMVTAAIGGSLWLRTRRKSGPFSLISTVILLPLTFFAVLFAIVTYIAKDGPWLHIRVRSGEGDRISLSLPFPLNVLRGGLRMARSQIDDDEIGDKVDAVADLLEALETADPRDPVSIDVMDNGDSIQIYLG